MSIPAFNDLLVDLDGGETAAECTRQLAAVVAAVKGTRLGGSMTLTIAVKPGQRGDAIQVTPKVTTKIPTRAADAQIYFATDEGELSRSNPRQQELVGLEPTRTTVTLETPKKPHLVDINKKAQ